MPCLRTGLNGRWRRGMPINVYDQASRYAIRCDPLGFLAWLFEGLALTLKVFGWLDTPTLPFPGERDRTCDTVAELAEAAEGGPRWAALIEFETDPESDILDRELEYVARLRRALRYGPQERERYQVIAGLV